MTAMNQVTYVLAILSAAFVDIVFLAGFEAKECTHCLKLLHLGSFGVVFGINIWTMFFAGMILMRSIPRHMFGRAQSNVFPAYFSLSFSMVCLMLGAIFLQHPYAELEQWGDELFCQVLALASVMIAFAVELLLLFPQNMKYLNKMYILEREVGVGQEIGMKPQNEELEMNGSYQNARKSFNIWHGLSMLVNLGCLILLCYHLNYLAGLMGEMGEKIEVETDSEI